MLEEKEFILLGKKKKKKNRLSMNVLLSPYCWEARCPGLERFSVG